MTTTALPIEADVQHSPLTSPGAGSDHQQEDGGLRGDVEPVLDLEDLQAAISEDAFSFASPSSIGGTTGTLHLPRSSPSTSLATDDQESEVLSEPSDALVHSSEAPLDGLAPRSTTLSSSTVTPAAPALNGKVPRQRHASLSSRIFSSFSLSPSPSLAPSSSNSSLTIPSPSSPSFPTGSLTSPPSIASKSAKSKRHKRTGSIASISTAASGTSVNPGEDALSASVGSSGTGGKSESGYSEWLAWRSWTRGKDRDDGGKKSALGVVHGDESNAGDAILTGGQDWEGRSRGDSSATAFSSNVGTSAGGGVEDVEPEQDPDHATVEASLASDSRSISVSVETTGSDDTGSTSPPTSTSDAKKPPPPSTAPSVAAGSPLSRSRGTSMPPLLSAQQAVASPTLSMPVPTSTLSTAPILSSPNHLSRGLSHSRKSSRRTSDGGGGLLGHRLGRPTHFTAIAISAGQYVRGEPRGLLKGGSEKIKELADALLSNVAQKAPAQDQNSRTSLLPDETDDSTTAALVGIDVDPDRTLRAKRSNSVPSPTAPRPATFFSPSKPLYSAAELSPPAKSREKSYMSSAKGTLGRALGLGASASSSMGMSRSSSDGVRRASRIGLGLAEEEPNLTMFPKLTSLSKYSPFAQPALSTPSTYVSLSSHSPSSTAHAPPPISSFTSAPTTMELGAISSEAAPPTLSIQTASQGTSDDGPMVDRYGFVYDVRSGMKLLREARKRRERAAKGESALDEDDDGDALRAAAELIDEAHAPASETNEGRAQVEVDAEMEALREALGLPPSSSTSPTQPRSPMSRLGKVLEEDASRSASSLLEVAPSPSSSSRPASPRSPDPPRSTRLVRSTSTDGISSPTPGGQQSMKRLLGQLTEMYDAVEKTQKEAWEGFIGRRQAKLRAPLINAVEGGPLRRGKRQNNGLSILAGDGSKEEDQEEGWSENLVGVAQMGLAGKSGREDWAEFKMIWAECSGANEAREPGVYQELLALHAGEANLCLTQIDMDCHRTFPTNVFFAGAGPGVTKLRNVLIAYSWRNPKIGYCQGMNNLTATLLLTYPSEEDAFWVLVCMIEKILPSDYYTSHLLVSQADQRVLKDLVERHLPDLAAHLEELGVELPAVTFGWFLSLFTDALPIQTLLRVWDLLFVFGTVILFRVAVAILQMNSAELFACDSAATLYALMRNMTLHQYQVDRLLKIACEDLRTVVKDRDIFTLRNRHVGDLQAELGITPDEGEEE
ncbi:hypothetical protein MNV49_007466 [Pseudohyphozyma bogoriensis]|nr:hypothetical protein MNV49_007466 [Pseudohyphozyma bogoriensis]